MECFDILPAYAPLSEALDRGFLKWGSTNRLGGLKGLLLSGALIAYAVDHAGQTTKYSADTWQNPDNDYLLTDPPERRVEWEKRISATVFLQGCSLLN